jgi:hypothetical protein
LIGQRFFVGPIRNWYFLSLKKENKCNKILWVCFQVNVPVFTLPMTLVTLVLINVTDERGRLYRVEDMSYPEKQSYQWHTSMRVKTTKVLF